MPKLLAIEASPRFDRSTSRKLTAVFVDKWKAVNPDGSVIVRDLVKTALPFVDRLGSAEPSLRWKRTRLKWRRQSRYRTISLPS